ncbi:MAG: hypothetical protein CSA22_02580 [Deltaproteobacteria bacterium]|nr:MAG: hypothetical protein CSA22_02580 [Deltaproteobacteria bacterium]
MITLSISFADGSQETREALPENTVMIGRADDCDVQLAGGRVSRNHARIYNEDGRWMVEDLKSTNGLSVNDIQSTRYALNNGDVIRIAENRIRVTLPVETGGAEDSGVDPDATCIEPVMGDPEPDATFVVSREAMMGSVTGKGAATGNVAAFVREKPILALVGALLLVILISIVVLLSGNENPAPETPKLAVVPEDADTAKAALEQKRKIGAYLQRGEMLLAAGEVENALIRFDAILELDPGHRAAATLAARCRREIDARDAARRQAEEKASLAAEKLNKGLELARYYHSHREWDQCIAMLDSLAGQIAEGSAEAKEVSALRQTASDALKKAAAARKKQSEVTGAIQRQVNKGSGYYKKRNYYKALLAWRKGVKISPNHPLALEIKDQMIPKAVSALNQRVAGDYQRAVQYKNRGDDGEALIYFDRVVNRWPEYKDAARQRNAIEKWLEDEAKRLYQEGKVYEGIGQMDKAIRKWEAVLEKMPLKSNAYYKKAAAKLGR